MLDRLLIAQRKFSSQDIELFIVYKVPIDEILCFIKYLQPSQEGVKTKKVLDKVCHKPLGWQIKESLWGVETCGGPEQRVETQVG